MLPYFLFDGTDFAVNFMSISPFDRHSAPTKRSSPQNLMRLESDTLAFTSTAQDEMTSTAERCSDFQEILEAGIAAARGGDRGSARRLLFQASGIDPRCEDIWMWLASISDYPEELLIFLGNALDINPNNERAIEWRASTRSLMAKTFVQRAAAAHQEGAFDQARQSIEHALAYDSECEHAWLWKASLSDDENEKIGFLERVLEIDPENADARTALDSILTERSRSAFDDVRSAAVAGRRKKALELVDEFLRSEPKIADAWILRSHLSLSLGEKIESLQKALEIDPENATARSAYDFLTATVGTATDNGDQPAMSSGPEARDPSARYSADGEETVNGSVEAELSGTDLIEKPLDLVFEGDPSNSAVEGEDRESVSVEHPIDAIEEDDDQTYEYKAVVEPIGTDDSFDDPSPAQFENTFLETFDTPVADFPATEVHQHNTKDVQVLDLEEAREYEYQPEFSGSQDTTEIDLDLARVEAPEEPLELDAEEFEREHVVLRTGSTENACPYCGHSNEPQAFSCDSCRAALTLSDIDSLLHNQSVDRGTLQAAVTQMEAEWNLRDFTEEELTRLGIGYLNLGDYQSGLQYIQEALRLDPNNVILAGQLNAIAIRLDEMRRQTEVHDTMPKGKTILVVDDSATVRKLISSKLEKSGHYVICAEDGVEALDRLTERVPDLVLLDISMPRMDGYEVCKQIRANPAARDLPVVMISGKDGFFDKVRGRMAGSTGYVTKPFGPETLMKALETYLLPEPQLAD